MYAANYGFGNPPFNPAAQQQQPQQPPQPGAPPGQHIMYNHHHQQQFAGLAPQGGFNPAANPQMMQGMPTGMMHNLGMPNMAANGQMPTYPQQFPGAPYGQMMPQSVGPQGFAPNNYMMAGGGMQAFPMNQGAAMPQQQAQMMQRMQAQQPNPVMSQASTPQRPPSAPQAPPINPMAAQQGQFSTPQGPPSQSQTPSSSQMPPAAVATPQTPTFSANHGGAVALPTPATPMSPASEAREKERFALLLDINHELIYESLQIQTTQRELKKEHAAGGNPPDRKPTDEENLFQQDYLHCMRRLQANLSYMAALADRKPEVKVPPCPAYLSPPPLNLALRLRALPIGAEGMDASSFDPVADRAERDQAIRNLYRRLQAVFPEFDPKKEPAFAKGAAGQKPGALGTPNQVSPTVQQPPQMPNMPAPPANLGGM